MEEFSFLDINTLTAFDKQNGICVDCRNVPSFFASVNNGILICSYCATKHLKLGYNVSYLKEITSEWDEYLLSFIQRGGNSRFIQFSIDYQLTSIPVDSKYKTKASEYYRKLILSEVQAEEPPKSLPKHEGLEFYSGQMIFSEFSNYQLYKGKKAQKIKCGSNLLFQGGSLVFNSLISSSGYLYNTSKNAALYMTKKTANGLSYAYSQIVGGNENEENKEGSIDRGLSNLKLNNSAPINTDQLKMPTYQPYYQPNTYTQPLQYQQPHYYQNSQYNCNYPSFDIQQGKLNNNNQTEFYNKLLTQNNISFNQIQNNGNNNIIISEHNNKDQFHCFDKNNIPSNMPHYNEDIDSSKDYPDIEMINNTYTNEQAKPFNYDINPYINSTPLGKNEMAQKSLLTVTQGQFKEGNDLTIIHPDQHKDNDIVLPQISTSDQSIIVKDSNITPS